MENSGYIHQSTMDDVTDIFKLYQYATDYQKEKFPDNTWPTFERSMVEKEVENMLQYKFVVTDNIACVWAITHSDPQIWQEKNNDPAVYIHRIATNPSYRGHNYVKIIVDWAREYCAKQGLDYIRLDTCGHNEGLIKHYTSCGFTFLGIEKIKDSTGLPPHYVDADVCYFEISV
jgi:ribosomal protein S18 acetylase RimI-like enzyme